VETEVVYAGKTIDLIPKVLQVVKDLTAHGLEHAILLPSSKSGKEVAESLARAIPKRYDKSTFCYGCDREMVTLVRGWRQRDALCFFGNGG